jgi:hypothetical protein
MQHAPSGIHRIGAIASARGALQNRDPMRGKPRIGVRIRPRISGAPHASTQHLIAARVLRRIRGTGISGRAARSNPAREREGIIKDRECAIDLGIK